MYGLKLCEYGLCFYTTNKFELSSGSSLGLGWDYILLFFIIGFVSGFILSNFIKITIKKKEQKKWITKKYKRE